MTTSKKQGKEVVENPPHYKARVSSNRMKLITDRILERGHLEAIDVIDAFGLNFNLGSIVKYVLRCGQKDDEITELKKAAWYLNDEISLRECDTTNS